MTHSVEPWRAGHRHGTIVSGGRGPHTVAESVSVEDIRRILACLAICSGISTEALEELGVEALVAVERKP